MAAPWLTDRRAAAAATAELALLAAGLLAGHPAPAFVGAVASLPVIVHVATVLDRRHPVR